MRKLTHLILLAAVAVALAGCRGEKKPASDEPQTFQFTIYPGSRYLQQVTEVFKQASKVFHPNEEVPPMAIYDTDAPVEKVAEFYAKAYGFPTIAPDATNDMNATKPPAYYKTGDIHTDVMAIAGVAEKLNLKIDTNKAQGTYHAAEIAAKPNRPHVTIQRPYFDVTKSEVVDRTIILMAR